MKAVFLMNNSMGKGSLLIKLANMLVLLTMVRKKEGVYLRGEMGKDSKVITIVISRMEKEKCLTIKML